MKVVWYAGGHDPRLGPGTADLRDQVAGWFDFHLRGRGDNPGTGFEFPEPTGLGSTGGVTRVQGGNRPCSPRLPGLDGGAPASARTWR